MKYLKKIINIFSNKTDGMSDKEYMQRYNYTQALNFPESCINYNPMGINSNKNSLSPCIGIDMDKVYDASALACKAVTYTGKYHILSLVNNKYYIYHDGYENLHGSYFTESSIVYFPDTKRMYEVVVTLTKNQFKKETDRCINRYGFYRI